MKMEEDIITLKNVGRHYQMGSSTIKALDEVSVSVKKKDFILIIGPSGSGKSTMMNMIGALDYPTKGEIYLEGQNMRAARIRTRTNTRKQGGICLSDI